MIFPRRYVHVIVSYRFNELRAVKNVVVAFLNPLRSGDVFSLILLFIELFRIPRFCL